MRRGISIDCRASDKRFALDLSLWQINKTYKKGPRTVVHPKARIIAEAGPIVIGEGNLIEEQALIINGYPKNITADSQDEEPKTMTIGINNVFEVGCGILFCDMMVTKS
ncbi:hypothetical protein NHX12_018423 [Muraenolepis orangiensis]|uniref:Dynactin subunit 6 n=1 Tax=Muraenolepis orangiensis TaxID=630683 RepID=A0A9Q0EZR1_9TELE|nr:hypothetical protein NHX12_018423 [Muraenolepis orangiensis]